MAEHYRWKVATAATQEQLSQFPELDARVVQLLLNRGITNPKEAEQFVMPDYEQDQHDPFLFKDMRIVVDRIQKAIDNNERVVVHGDYDADGVCGATVLYVTLKKLGVNVDVYLPHRDTEGYGLNMNTVQSLADTKTDLIITVDCGISNKPEVEKAVELGMDVIVTDHHSEPPELPSKAMAILNPKVSSETYPFKYLAGVGVAFKVSQALIREHKLGDAFEKWLLDAVAISTITDCVPLIGENRLFVHYGLVVMQKNRRVGLAQLLAAMAVDPATASAETIGFKIGPHINAAGRVKHANMAFELLVEEDPEKAATLAQELAKTNRNRQQLSDAMAKQALAQAEEQKDQFVIIVQSEDWPVGLVGLVAGRVASKYHRPTFVVTKMGGDIVGSGRSIEHFNLVEALQSMPEVFSKYGGHPMACGFSLKDNASFDQFIERMRARAKELLGNADLTKTLSIESEVALPNVDWSLVDIVKTCAPYGEGNREPIFASRDVVIEDMKLIGKTQSHLRMTVSQNGTHRPCIGFGKGEWMEEFHIGQHIDIAYQVGVNEWNGHRDIQLQIRDLLPHS
jgi:single-stranded-DNA-specific exonuclease